MKLRIEKREILSWSISIVVFTVVATAWFFFGEDSPRDILDNLPVTASRETPAVLPTFPNQGVAVGVPMQAGQNQFARNATLLKPAVITICTLGTIQGQGYHLEFMNTGTIIHPNGFILTNYSRRAKNKDLKVIFHEF
ncbi:MAG: hypothetical protein HQK83_04445, partial [Fibrobacteria bacterium]|nr:hypothetical protein [Fibrobacteria bacterium]